MDEKEAKISISYSEGKFEISGSESFVNQQIENFKSLIFESLNKLSSKNINKTITPDNTDVFETVKKTLVNNQDSYDDIFIKDTEGKIKLIIQPIPGNTDSQKMRNIVLLYCFACKLEGQQTVSVSEAREACKQYGFNSMKNFSSYMKKSKPDLVLSGKNSNQTIAITTPGTQSVKDLIKEIRQNIK